jgi:hypothetical protein
VASATLNTGQQVGGSIGTSLLNTIFASAVVRYLTSHLSPATLVHGLPAPSLAAMSLIHGYTTGFWVAAAIFGAGAVICGTLLRSGPLPVPGPAAAPASAASQSGTGHAHLTPSLRAFPCAAASRGRGLRPDERTRIMMQQVVVMNDALSGPGGSIGR